MCMRVHVCAHTHTQPDNWVFQTAPSQACCYPFCYCAPIIHSLHSSLERTSETGPGSSLPVPQMKPKPSIQFLGTLSSPVMPCTSLPALTTNDTNVSSLSSAGPLRVALFLPAEMLAQFYLEAHSLASPVSPHGGSPLLCPHEFPWQ